MFSRFSLNLKLRLTVGSSVEIVDYTTALHCFLVRGGAAPVVYPPPTSLYMYYHDRLLIIVLIIKICLYSYFW